MTIRPSLLAPFAALALACSGPEDGRPDGRADRPAGLAAVAPAPTDPRTGGEGEEDDDRRRFRERWVEEMHRAAPGIDWRAVERANQDAERLRRNAAVGAGSEFARGAASAPWIWEEVGSSNQAGHTRCAALGATRPEGRFLYVGSAGGGLWRGREDGTEWTPLSDSVYGGVDDVIALEPADLANPDILVMRRGSQVLRSADGGATWTEPSGLGALRSVRRMVRANDATRTIYLFGSAIVSTLGERSALFASIDEGRTFVMRSHFGGRWPGDVWVPRTTALGGSAVYVLQRGRLFVSTDDGNTFGPGLAVDTGATEGDLVGSEAGGPTLYVALRQSNGDWDLHRSDDAGQSSNFVRTLNAFWGATTSMAAFAHDASRLMYGGVEAWVSTDGGSTSARINTWGSYYGDPANRLHADIRGISPLVDLDAPGEPDRVYINTDGGTYVTVDGGATVQNLSLSGLGVGQFYSTHTAIDDPQRISGGTQDQGYQVGDLLPSFGAGPSTPFDQIISGDYGHLVSGDGTHRYVYSTYPGFILVQVGSTNPSVRFVDFPAGSQQLWLPPVVADPNDRSRFFFLADRLHRYTRSGTEWTPSLWSGENFAAGSSRYLTAMAFAPSDSNRAYAITDAGRIHVSDDGGVTWTQSASAGPGSHYFYGAALLVDPADPDHAFVAGSGYGSPGVRETTDGGVNWQPRSSGLPSTLVHDLAWSPDGSGDLFAATEAGAYHFDAASAAWSNAMGSEAPSTNYWTVETVEATGRVRFGTYGRGIWDLVLIDGSGDVGVRYCSPAQGNSAGPGARIRALGSPFVADADLTLVADEMPPNTVGFFLVAPAQGFIAGPGGSAGNLCLGGSIGRYQATVLNSGALGTFAMAVDLAAIPQPTGDVAAVPGDTWFFQAWFRDAIVSIPTSNFTDGVAVRLR
ncbi:MAG: hypothetical protein AAGI22_00610 [Planctomycetota bacterium]